MTDSPSAPTPPAHPGSTAAAPAASARPSPSAQDRYQLTLPKGDAVVIARRLIFGLFVFGLLMLNYTILHLFIIPVIWAAILAYLSWPLYRRLRAALDDAPGLSALLMTLALGALFVGPLIWLVALLQADLPRAYHAVVAYTTQTPADIARPLTRLPWIGPEIEALAASLPQDPAVLRSQLLELAKPLADDAAKLLGGVGRNAVKFSIALLTVFFIYRHGEELLAQTRQVLWRFMGGRSNAYLTAIADTSRAVMYGLILTALAQGLLAGLGYWAAGIPAAVLLGALTAILALIPFGPPLIWVPAGLWLLFEGRWLPGIGLLIWGAFAVSWIDNLVRPMVISGATRIPFLLVMFGVLGGVAAYGLLGLFLGPIAVAILLAVWREWLGEHPLFDDPHDSLHASATTATTTATGPAAAGADSDGTGGAVTAATATDTATDTGAAADAGSRRAGTARLAADGKPAV